MRCLLLLTLLCTFSADGNVLLKGGGPSITPPLPSCTGAPNTNSCAAATYTADNNSVCTGQRPFYWEIGTSAGPLVADLGVTGAPANSLPAINATTYNQYDSSSKWFMGMYVTQLRGGDSNLTANDIAALNQTDGYANNETDVCPLADSLPTCLAIVNNNAYNISSAPRSPCGNPVANYSIYCGEPQSYQASINIAQFFYAGVHFTNEAQNNTPLAGDTRVPLVAAVVAELTNGCTLTAQGTQLPELCAAYQSGNFKYGGVNVAGQINGTATAYRSVLKGILSGQLYMSQSLNSHPVCANPGGNFTSNPPGGSSCNALYSPITNFNQHYSIGHWVEDWYISPTIYGDGAYSSPGAKGYYQWIDATLTYYGVMARVAKNGGQGQVSEQCGALIRNAFTCGVNQTGTLPVPCTPFVG